MPGTNLTFDEIRTDLVPAPSMVPPSDDRTSYFDVPLDDDEKEKKEKVDCSHIQSDCAATNKVREMMAYIAGRLG